ncbi:hypothetical protein MUK42_25604 [Musa troglodytarum]|uniref:Uncharacterized protein n=1 Tax=Musa troglodytarum TaxID=320322 RepID=A0A9E7H499_9LILI|nr:hypothetical protein MUK42_25604 [Musa troglodytarum]
MAAISTTVASSSSPALNHRMVLSLSLSRAAYCKLLPLVQRSPTFRCSTSRRDGRRAAPLLQLAVGGVTEILRLLSPKKQRDEAKAAEQAPSLARSVDDVIRILRADYDRAYFLTGEFTSDIYADDCLFEDPTINFRGTGTLRIWTCLFLSLIVHSLNLRISRRTYLKLPWRPLIAIRGTTTYDLGEDFKIIRHAESWSVSALEAVGQIFKLGYVEVDETKRCHRHLDRRTWDLSTC